jgi:hypothetical protein
MDATTFEDYADGIDEYPGYHDEVNVNGPGHPSRFDPETCALEY